MGARQKHPQLLLVEGLDDQHVIWALCQKFNLTENFEVIDCKGIDKLLEQIPVRMKQSGITTLGVIVDADAQLASRWNSLRDIFGGTGFSLQGKLPSEGLIAEGGRGQRIGVWVMPNNDLNGMLEDFISFLVPSDDQLLPRVEANLEEIERQGLNKYQMIHKSKAVIHSWLALQKDPGTPMGLSITKKYLTTDEETCAKLINWLIRLFDPS